MLIDHTNNLLVAAVQGSFGHGSNLVELKLFLFVEFSMIPKEKLLVFEVVLKVQSVFDHANQFVSATTLSDKGCPGVLEFLDNLLHRLARVCYQVTRMRKR